MQLVYKYGFILLLFLSMPLFAQLPDFDLQVIPTDENCRDAGALTFVVSNTVPGATFTYSVLSSLNEERVTNNNFLDALSAGTYTVTAIQKAPNGDSNIVVVKNVVILNKITPLQFNITTISRSCTSAGGEIIVNVTSGTGVMYEIVGDPTRGLQASNVFTGLGDGQYLIGVVDNCGAEVTRTFTVTFDPGAPVLSPPIFDAVLTGDCETVTIKNTISYTTGTLISYPLTITYTIHPPDGAPDIIVVKEFTSGAPDLLEFSNTFTDVDGKTYTYDISVTNGCGLTFGQEGMSVNPEISLNAAKVRVPCGKYYITLSAEYFKPPYTINFVSTTNPAFNASNYNSTYPGPFTASTTNYGSAINPVPEGDYQITITDACGRTKETLISIVNDKPVPGVQAVNNGCFSNLGTFNIVVPELNIVSAIITTAPGVYVPGLPHNVTSFITADGILSVTDVPVGHYIVHVIDSCGNEYDVDVTVPDFIDQDFVATPLADCNAGIGALKIASGNGGITSLQMISGPAGVSVPQDVSVFIGADRVFYMDNLTVGNYVFKGTDVCGLQKTVSVTITGYQPSAIVPFTFIPNCNSFEIKLFDPDTSTSSPTYWLQKENPNVSGQWGHPLTGVVYTEGTLPDSSNSLSLTNSKDISNINLVYFGNFRILKAFLSVKRGGTDKVCTEVLGDPFKYQFSVTIDNVFGLTCNLPPGTQPGTMPDVYIDATGVAPLTYSITEINGVVLGVPINNGTNNIFKGLTPAIYKFVVHDGCSQSDFVIRDISILPDLVTAVKPTDMLICIPAGASQFQQFDLTAKTSEILGGQSPDVYSVTYYLSQSDANNNVNAIQNPESFTNTLAVQVIYAKVKHKYITVCDEIVSFTIRVSAEPVVTLDEEAYICEDEGKLLIIADAGYDTYLWSTGQTTRSITVTEPGTYSVTISKLYGAVPCSTTVDIAVLPSGPANAITVDTIDWTTHDNSIFITVGGGIGEYEYSLDNATYQDSPEFTNLDTGLYTVYVRDKAGCGTVTKQVALLNYPKFFTPNGDGHHETWRIEFSGFEPNMLVFIYDRYGMLITSFGSKDAGWDGTFNGHQLPSTDYWFVVNRQDGKVYKGHFSLIR